MEGGGLHVSGRVGNTYELADNQLLADQFLFWPRTF